jgi:hypothetical protein
MNESDKRTLRESASHVEAAESSVLEMIGLARDAGRSSDDLSLGELGALKEISANLRAACTRMWSMTDER